MSANPTGMFAGTSATAEQTTNAPNGAEETTLEVDLNATVEVKDSTTDFNIIPPPPKAGKYPVKWELNSEKGIEPKNSPKVGNFLNVYLVGHIIAEGTEYDGYTISEYMNSIYNKLKGTSELHDFLNKLGSPAPNRMTLGELKQHAEQVLAQNPVGTIELEWSASEKNPGAKNANKDGYVTLKNRMSQFTKNPDGSYVNTTPSAIDGSPVAARGYVFAHLRS